MLTLSKHVHVNYVKDKDEEQLRVCKEKHKILISTKN